MIQLFVVIPPPNSHALSLHLTLSVAALLEKKGFAAAVAKFSYARDSSGSVVDQAKWFVLWLYSAANCVIGQIKS